MKKGFTLIELLITMLIIGIIASLAVVGLTSVRSKSRDTRRISDIRQIQNALEIYRNDNNVYPSAITSGESMTGENDYVYMSKVPTAPGINDGDCESDAYTYGSTDTSITYSITYCLGGVVQSAGPGNLVAIPGDIAAAVPAPEPQAYTSTNSPGTAANDTSVGNVGWNNFDFIKVSNDERANALVGTLGDSYYLKATNFGFTIPTGATINGIVVEWEKGVDGVGGVFDRHTRIVKADGTIGTTNRAITTNQWAAGDNYITSGGSTDLWGETWTAANINDADFGCVLSAFSDSEGVTALIDHVRITVYYTN